MLNNINFLPQYSKVYSDLYNDFYKPCMENAIKYDRISGYFGSSVFIVINKSLQHFIANGGRIRLICSPNLIEEDVLAIQKGYTDRVYNKVTTELNEVFAQLCFDYPKSSELLSTLIKNDILDIKLAVFGNNPDSTRLMHEKVGLFSDREGNTVGFRGSMNETFKGLSRFGNGESFDVFTSWDDYKDQQRVLFAKEIFDRIWNGTESNVITFEIPKITLEQIKSYSSSQSYKDLLEETVIELDDFELIKKFPLEYKEHYCIGELVKLSDQYEYNSDDSHKVYINGSNITFLDYGVVSIFATKKDNSEIHALSFFVEKWIADSKGRLPRDYQTTILNNWEKLNYSGLFEMATGSGKTFTALCAIRLAIYKFNKIPLIIVPSQILFDQWSNEIKYSFGESVLVYKFGSGYNGLNSLQTASTISNRKKLIIVTLQSASKMQFFDRLVQGDHLFVVIDEVHNAGSTVYSNVLNINSSFRIGLSATPYRFRDNVGTNRIKTYFQNVIEPRFSLEDAIKCNALCEYYYYPTIVSLTESEKEAYIAATNRISKIYAMLKSNKLVSEDEIFNDVKLKKLLIERADVIKKAEEKTSIVIDILKKNFNINQTQRWLVYCDDIEQLERVRNAIQINIGYLIHNNMFEYHSKTEYKDIVIDMFIQSGGILLAINCLDEGVDIPSIDHAIILSSSQNYRQFIQRRGRVLRNYNNKLYAYIYDAVVSPTDLEHDQEYPFLIYELKRSILFAKHAVNSIAVLQEIREIAIKNNIAIEQLEDEPGGIENE